MLNDMTLRLEKLGINAEEVLTSLTFTVEPYTVFLSGSIIEGYGNVDSDLDVFVIYPEQIPSLEADFSVGNTLINMEYTTNWRMDVESWTREQVELVAQHLSQHSASNWNQSLRVSIDELNFAHRIRIGVPVLHPEHFQQLQQAFNFEYVSRIIMNRNLIWYTGVQEDAAGAIASKQYGTALLMGREAVQLAIDILIASQGETNTKAKWRFFKLEKLGDPALLERYWELETPTISTKDDVLKYAKECIIFASQLVLKVQKAKG
ncbi:MAG TPA: hypothetical protein VKR06_36475 [Ktedonosporobacter sp.]|nr:hypothetical protein [Ktedonosporobacter sp.]